MPKKLFITISPPNRTLPYALLKFKNPLFCCYLDDKTTIEHAFNQYKVKHFIFYPELDSKGRLHYHGRVTLTPSQEVSYYKSIRPKLQRIGFVDTQPILHDLENLIYCMKSWSQTQAILDISKPIGGKVLKSLYSGVPPEGVPHRNNEYLEGPSILDYLKITI